jgi:iron complex transport system substrate-binding protein
MPSSLRAKDDGDFLWRNIFLGGFFMKKFLLVSVLSLFFVLSFSVTLVDDLGRVVEFEDSVERIVSAAPVVSDYIVHLESENKVVGVTDWDVHIEAEKIGNVFPLNMEKILSLNPDVVFLTGGFQEPEVKKLEDLGIKAFVVNPTSLNDIPQVVQKLGIILDKKDLSQKISSDFRKNISDIAKKTSLWKDKPRVFYAMISVQNISEIWTTGTGSFLNEAISVAGGLNVAAPLTGNNGWLSVGPEFILKENPDIIIVPSYFIGDNSLIDTIKRTEQFSSLKAVKNNNILTINNEKASQASPSILDIIEKMYDYFKEKK